MPKEHVRGAGRATTIWRDETTNTSLRCMTLPGSCATLTSRSASARQVSVLYVWGAVLGLLYAAWPVG